jgi:hypothetical protein
VELNGTGRGCLTRFSPVFQDNSTPRGPEQYAAYPIKKWAAGAALIAAFFYLLLSGAEVATQQLLHHDEQSSDCGSADRCSLTIAPRVTGAFSASPLVLGRDKPDVRASQGPGGGLYCVPSASP